MAVKAPARRRTVIVHDDPLGPSLRGAALDLYRSDDHEVMLAGPAETGKSFACLLKLDHLLRNVRNIQCVLVRRVMDTIFPTVLQTYLRKILQPEDNVTAYGGEKPRWFDYPLGGRLWLAGMDDPGKALSSERDFIYVNQAEELSADDWQVLTTRVTGRAGNTPRPQIIGDCNPGPPHHWIKQRSALRVLESRHEDNPTLWDGREWTEQGRRTLAVLDQLTGVRRERLRYGRWVSAEGTVYEFDARIHLLPRGWKPPEKWLRFRSIDFGFTNPFVCQWFAIDPDGRLYLYRELYMTQRTVQVHADQIKRLSVGEKYVATIADTDAEDRATLHQHGIWTLAALKERTVGIQAVQERLKVQPDGRPRLFIADGCLVERDESLAERRKPVCTRDEFDTYLWPKGADGKPVKEDPVAVDDHGMDGVRYAVLWADRRQRAGPIEYAFGGGEKGPKSW